jgi:hypothetical protein
VRFHGGLLRAEAADVQVAADSGGAEVNVSSGRVDLVPACGPPVAIQQQSAVLSERGEVLSIGRRSSGRLGQRLTVVVGAALLVLAVAGGAAASSGSSSRPTLRTAPTVAGTEVTRPDVASAPTTATPEATAAPTTVTTAAPTTTTSPPPPSTTQPAPPPSAAPPLLGDPGAVGASPLGAPASPGTPAPSEVSTLLKSCRREAGAVIAAGTLHNGGSAAHTFRVEVSFLDAADAVVTTQGATFNEGPGGTFSWQVASGATARRITDCRLGDTTVVA